MFISGYKEMVDVDVDIDRVTKGVNTFKGLSAISL